VVFRVFEFRLAENFQHLVNGLLQIRPGFGGVDSLRAQTCALQGKADKKYAKATGYKFEYAHN